jgi:hypothetical protein
MSTASRRRFVLIALAALAAVAGSVASLEAQGTPRAGVRFAGGFGGTPPSESQPVPTTHVTTPVTEPLARTWLLLQKPVKMSFPSETPLEDVIKYVKEATRQEGRRGIVIYVDPRGLQEAERSLTSPVTIDLEDVPLATSLRLLLKQLGMIYTVRADGMLYITGESSDDSPVEPSPRLLEDLDHLQGELARMRRELAHTDGENATGRPPQTTGSDGQARPLGIRRVGQFGGAREPDTGLPTVKTVHLLTPLSTKAAETWSRLQKVVDVPFDKETPLEEVLAFIKRETQSNGAKGIPLYVDPVGLQEAEKTMTSPVQLSMEGVSLATALVFVVKQLGLRYDVQEDGIVVITDESDDDYSASLPARMLDQVSAMRLEVESMRRWIREVGPARGLKPRRDPAHPAR